MAVHFNTTDPAGLLATFKKAINDRKVVTWSYDQAGHFTHTPEQWKAQAWLKPVIHQGRLTLNFVGRNDRMTTSEVYAVYHGRFIESMLAHCDKLFKTAEATALPTVGDQINTSAA
jgi:hypothetical protein